MPELLKIVLRGLTCSTWKKVGGTGESWLRCDLKPDHPGPLHYDEDDRIWWFADA